MSVLRCAGCVLLAASCAIAAAQDRFTKVADWTVQINAEVQQAYASSKTGAAFGVLCYLKADSCIAFLRTPTPCEDGTTTPMLMNASTAAYPINSTCIKLSGENGQPIFVNRIAEYEAAIRGAEAGGEFGIALPLQSGQFVVYRFSGRGALDAITAASTRPGSAPAKAGDQLL